MTNVGKVRGRDPRAARLHGIGDERGGNGRFDLGEALGAGIGEGRIGQREGGEIEAVLVRARQPAEQGAPARRQSFGVDPERRE